MERFSSLHSLFHHHHNKRNRLQCDIELTVESLVDVPLIHGQLYASIKLKNQVNEFKITSPLASIKDHCVVWDYQWKGKVYFQPGKDGSLSPCLLSVTIKRDTSRKGESIGKVIIDLADLYTSSGVGTSVLWPSQLISRQYLLQQSKMNSTLKTTFRIHKIKTKATNPATGMSSSAISIDKLSGGESNIALAAGRSDDVARKPTRPQSRQRTATSIRDMLMNQDEEAEDAYFNFSTEAKQLVDTIFQTIEDQYNNLGD